LQCSKNGQDLVEEQPENYHHLKNREETCAYRKAKRRRRGEEEKQEPLSASRGNKEKKRELHFLVGRKKTAGITKRESGESELAALETDCV